MRAGSMPAVAFANSGRSKIERVVVMYKADYEDDNFEVIYADNDKEAMEEAEKYENEHGILFNVYEIDDDYNEIRTIY